MSKNISAVRITPEIATLKFLMLQLHFFCTNSTELFAKCSFESISAESDYECLF